MVAAGRRVAAVATLSRHVSSWSATRRTSRPAWSWRVRRLRMRTTIGRRRTTPPVSRAGRSAPEASDDRRTGWKLVRRVVADGAGYVKIMTENGSTPGAPNLPALSNDTIVAGVAEAHKLGKMAVAHALSVRAFEQAIDAKIDGLVHLFTSSTGPPTPRSSVRSRRPTCLLPRACLSTGRSWARPAPRSRTAWPLTQPPASPDAGGVPFPSPGGRIVPDLDRELSRGEPGHGCSGGVGVVEGGRHRGLRA